MELRHSEPEILSDASLESAIAFVTQRIEDEARLEQEPLDDEQRFLLEHLPTDSGSLPLCVDPESLSLPALRDFNYEKLCRLAKLAIQHDREADPDTTINWHLAAAVFKLNDHPMAWLLAWGGVKPDKPWWDKWLLLLAGLLFVACGLPLMFIADSYSSPPTWILGGCVYAGAMVLLYFALRRFEKWQLTRTIEKLRDASHLG